MPAQTAFHSLEIRCHIARLLAYCGYVRILINGMQPATMAFAFERPNLSKLANSEP